MLPKHTIKEFQQIYFEAYGEMLSFEDATATSESFLLLYKSILKPSINGEYPRESTNHT